ncbi:hypothetical protein [Subtercola frigoramans]|uniref:hypothetical protein n=1 Tax=Subtercola frigoramans TaxID=120298 RepID=UPI0036D8168E
MTPVPSTTPSNPNPSSAALASVVLACQSWQTSLSQDKATFPTTQAAAAAQVSAAAAVDSQWQTLASDMSYLVSVIDDTSSEAQAKGQQTFTDLSNQCLAVGVTVNGG